MLPLTQGPFVEVAENRLKALCAISFIECKLNSLVEQDANEIKEVNVFCENSIFFFGITIVCVPLKDNTNILIIKRKRFLLTYYNPASQT